MIMYQNDPQENVGMTLDEAFDVLGELLESGGAHKKFAQIETKYNDLAKALDSIDHPKAKEDADKIRSKRDKLAEKLYVKDNLAGGKFVRRDDAIHYDPYGGKKWNFEYHDPNKSEKVSREIANGEAINKDVLDLKKFIGAGKDNMPKKREPGTILKWQNVRKDILKEACLTILAAIDEE